MAFLQNPKQKNLEDILFEVKRAVEARGIPLSDESLQAISYWFTRHPDALQTDIEQLADQVAATTQSMQGPSQVKAPTTLLGQSFGQPQV